MKFTIAIEAGTKKTAFGVVVPDLPGCFSAGDTIEEAFDNVREAIESFCEILAEEEKDIPVPRSMSEWQADKAYKGWTWGIVDVPIERFFGPAEKINITVPGRLLKQIDNHAQKYGQTRSGFLTEAALETMRLRREKNIREIEAQEEALRAARFPPGYGEKLDIGGDKGPALAELRRKKTVQQTVLDKATRHRR